MEERSICIVLDLPGLARYRAVSGIYRYARQRPDWQLYYLEVPRHPNSLNALIRDIEPDALFTDTPDAIRAFRRFRGNDVPYVLLTKSEPRWPDAHGVLLGIDNQSVGRECFDHLHQFGYRNFAYVGILFSGTGAAKAEVMHRYSRIRGGAFERRAAELGCRTACYQPSVRNRCLDREKLRAFLSSLPLPCGIMTYSDEDAQYVLSACRELKLSVPRQIGIIGVDNEEHICNNMMPTLTSAEVDFDGAGYRAGELLAEMLAGDRSNCGRTFMSGCARIVQRLSVQSINTSQNRVAKAMEIIRENLENPPSPEEIAQRMNLTLRVLELAFRETAGISPRTAILDLRLERARKMLKETKLSVTEVAFACGFNSYSSFNASLKRRTGRSPRNFQ